MSSVTKTQAQIDSEAAQNAIYAAANAKFIIDADIQIQQSIAQGLYFVHCKTSDNVNPTDLYAYYTNLGYEFHFPDFARNSKPSAPPSTDTGFWVSAWINTGLTKQKLEHPYRFIISWR